MVRPLKGLMSYDDMPWLPARAFKRWAKRSLKHNRSASSGMVGMEIGMRLRTQRFPEKVASAHQSTSQTSKDMQFF
jgi:hypothetical protein